MVIGRVEGDATCKLIHLNAALLPKECFPYEYRGAVWGAYNVVDAKIDVVKCDMIVIKTVCLRLEPIVVCQGTVIPVKTPYLVDVFTNVDISLSGHKPAEVAVDVQRVAWKMELDICLADGETVSIDAPLQGRRGGVGSCCIAEGDI